MVTSESNRGQSVTASPPFERQTQEFAATPEAPAWQPKAEERPPATAPASLWNMSLVVAGATMGAMGALGAVVPAILGLSGVAPLYMLPVAAIVLGLAFFILAGIGRRWAFMFPFAEHETRQERRFFSFGFFALLIAGLAGIILGIFNLAYVSGARFGALTAVVLGLGLLWHSFVMRRVSRFPYHGIEGHRLRGPLALNALSVAPVRDFLIGVASVVLGILALLNVTPLTLSFVALLSIGIGLAFTTSTICSATLAAMESHSSKGGTAAS
jgi:hypothetical protein